MRRFVSFLPVLLAACGGTDEPETVVDLFQGAVDEVLLQVAFEPGAEPYTGEAPFDGDLWDLFEANAAALFDPAGVRVTAPRTLAEFVELPDQTDMAFDIQELLDLAELIRPERQERQEVFQAIWLDGNFELDGEVLDDVLGVSLNPTGIIAMFKPVIRSASPLPDGQVARFVEQSTLVHEFGHAVGLVNQGLPLASPHHDEENGNHCTNDGCVMYWLNEGAQEVRDFVQDLAQSGSLLLFGPECIADAALAASGQG